MLSHKTRGELEGLDFCVKGKQKQQSVFSTCLSTGEAETSLPDWTVGLMATVVLLVSAVQ